MKYLDDVATCFVAVLKKWHGWLGGSALIGIVGFLQALKIWEHPTIKMYLGCLGAGFLVSFFEAWRDEYRVRLQIEDAANWDALGEKFKNLDDSGISIARWTIEVETGNCEWQVTGGSIIAGKLATEMCREAGAQLFRSKSFVSKFKEIAGLRDNGERWLVAIRDVGCCGKPAGEGRSIVKDVERNYKHGEIRDLKGASQVLCKMARNEFTQ